MIPSVFDKIQVSLFSTSVLKIFKEGLSIGYLYCATWDRIFIHTFHVKLTSCSWPKIMIRSFMEHWGYLSLLLSGRSFLYVNISVYNDLYELHVGIYFYLYIIWCLLSTFSLHTRQSKTYSIITQQQQENYVVPTDLNICLLKYIGYLCIIDDIVPSSVDWPPRILSCRFHYDLGWTVTSFLLGRGAGCNGRGGVVECLNLMLGFK